MPSATSATPFVRVFETPLGWFAMLGTSTGLTRLTFGHDSADDAIDSLPVPGDAELDSCPDWMIDAEDLLSRFADGEPVDLNEIPLDLPKTTAFEDQVRRSLQRVGFGETISYADLAAAAGSPGAARAVGNIMRKNPVPLVIACHRVIGAGGKLGGYSAPSGLAMKKHLLQLERGVCVPVAAVR